MAASSTAQLSLLLAHDRSSGYTSSSGPAPTSTNLNLQAGLVNRGSLRHSGAIAVTQGSGCRKRLLHIVGARRPGKDRDGALAEAVEDVKIPDNSEPDDMFMGRKLEGLEPDFWEGEKWDTVGFIIQYLWAFGILIAASEADGISKPLIFIGLKSAVMGGILLTSGKTEVFHTVAACGVSVTQYNSGATDIRDTDVFKEALENQVDADSSFESDSFQGFPEASEAPSLE